MRATPPVPPAAREPAARRIPYIPDATAPTLAIRPRDRAVTPSRQSLWPRIRRQLPLLGILLIATYLITINVTSPWQSMHEDNGTLNESIAVNHIRFGLGVTKGQDLLDLEAKQSFGPANVTEAQHFAYFLTGSTHPQVYGDHPPLLDLTIAGSFLVFGMHFWSERLVPIVYALLGLLVFYHLVRRLWDITVARVSALLYGIFPLFAYFGRNVSHESAVLFWALLLLQGYVDWSQRQRPHALILMAVATAIGGAYGWPLFYFAPILCAVDWATRRAFDKRLALATVLPAALTFILVMAQLTWALNGDLSRLGAMFLHRTSGSGEDAVATSAIAWFNQLAVWNAEDFGSWSQLALPIAAGFIAMRAAGEGLSLRWRITVILALWGLSHVIIFRNGAFVHAYWQFYLLPVYALVLAWAFVTWARGAIPARNGRILVTALACFAVISLNLGPILSLYSTGYHTTLPVVPLFDLWR